MTKFSLVERREPVVRKTRSALKQPFYLWIVGIYPILHLYFENYGLVIDREVPPVTAAALAATTFAFFLTKRFFPDIHTRAFILSIWSLAYSLSGHIYVELIIPRSLTVWTIALVFVCVKLTSLLKRRSFSRRYARLTATLNIIATVMLTLQLAGLASRIAEELRSESIVDAYLAAQSQHPTAAKALDSPELPDIYYIIPDAYPSDAWHLEAMNHDNSAFTEALQALGFQVAAHAQSNYSATYLSLPSTLNMRYIDSNPTNFSHLGYIRLAVNDSAVARELLRRGYTYVQLLSGSIGPSPIADINRDFTSQGPFDIPHADISFLSEELLSAKQSFPPLYIDTTLLRAIRSQLAKLLPESDVKQLSDWAPERFLYSLAELESIAQMPEATFTIAHLMKPHNPVTFNRAGEIIATIFDAGPEEYIDELHFINQQLLATIEKLIKASPRETVIILQADHGSTWGNFFNENSENTYFDVYAGYYLPAGFELEFPDPFTLINTFPLLFNALFDTDISLQEDRFFTLQADYDTPMNQREVTREWLQKTAN